jgi:F-type H+-transporting ATPase subunit a
MSGQLHIAISPETLFQVGGFEVTNTLFTSYVVTIVLVAFLLYARSQIKQTSRPRGLQNVLEAIVGGMYSFFDSITHSPAKTAAFAPLIGGFFFFILLNNWVELLPGFHTIIYTGQPGIHLTQIPQIPGLPKVYASTESVAQADSDLTEVTEADDIVSTQEHEEEAEEHEGVALFRGANADINMTLALALISVASVQYFGFKYAGLKYGKKYINFSSPIFFFVGILEIISEISKILSFAFRLFGNVFAGEVLIAVISFLIPVVLPMPFVGLEIFVGFIQALVFAMLTLVFINMATEAHH